MGFWDAVTRETFLTSLTSGVWDGVAPDVCADSMMLPMNVAGMVTESGLGIEEIRCVGETVYQDLAEILALTEDASERELAQFGLEMMGALDSCGATLDGLAE